MTKDKLSDHVFSLPFRIAPETQRRLIEWQEAHAHNPYVVYEYAPHRHTTDFHNIALEARQTFPRRDRLCPEANWLWWDYSDASDLVLDLLRPLKSLYTHLGSVMMHVWQVPNPGLQPHYDFRMHKSVNHPEGRPENFWRVFIPLSENSSEPENPPLYVVSEVGEMISLSSDHHYFMMHDPTLLHGVEPRPWRRGYISVDGRLSSEGLKKIAKIEMRVHKTQSLEEGLGPGVFERIVRERDLSPGHEDHYSEFHQRISGLQDQKRLERLTQRANWKGEIPRHFATQMGWPRNPTRPESNLPSP